MISTPLWQFVANEPAVGRQYVFTAAINDRSDQIAVQVTAALHATSPSIPHRKSEKTKWRVSLFPRGGRPPTKNAKYFGSGNKRRHARSQSLKATLVLASRRQAMSEFDSDDDVFV